MKNIKKKDIILIVVIALLAVCLLFCGLFLGKRHTSAAPAQTELDTDNVVTAEAILPEGVLQEVSEAVETYLAQNPAESYLLISTASGSYLPIPLSEDAAFKIHFGEEEYNLVHIGKNSVYMEESTCENQNCVGQGEVTLENKDTRALMGMILCLPHELSLELVDRAGAEDYLTEYFTYLAENSAAEDAGNAG